MTPVICAKFGAASPLQQLHAAGGRHDTGQNEFRRTRRNSLRRAKLKANKKAAKRKPLSTREPDAVLREGKDQSGKKKTTELHELATHIDAQLQAVRRHLRSGQNSDAKRGNLTGPQQAILSAIVRAGAVSLKELARDVNLAHSTVSGIIDRLEARSMVERHTSKTDARITELHPSPQARKWVRDTMPQMDGNALLGALERASKKERRNIARGLNTLERLLNGSAEPQ
jgi:DNA-binding MarR family transcriptional regulator